MFYQAKNCGKLSRGEIMTEIRRIDTEAVRLSATLLTIAERIRERVARTAYETGKDLVEAKALCLHGEWLRSSNPWASGPGRRKR